MITIITKRANPQISSSCPGNISDIAAQMSHKTRSTDLDIMVIVVTLSNQHYAVSENFATKLPNIMKKKNEDILIVIQKKLDNKNKKEKQQRQQHE